MTSVNYIAIRMNCFNPRFTECRTFEYFQDVEGFGSDWLIFDVSRTNPQNLNSHVQLAFDYETGRHLSRPW
jgi:hypothetical protein